MKYATLVFWLGATTTLAAWLAWSDGPGLSDYARAQVSDLEISGGKVIPSGKDGIEVLTHGPVHEAFAQPGSGKLGATITVEKKPPEPIEELPPDQKPEGDNVVWISGYWAWDDDRDGFIWVSGFWRQVPHDKEWVPGYWDDEDDGWRWVSGYWAAEGQAEVELLPTPPSPVVEAQPPQPATETVYVPGTWVWRETRYYWRPGFWVPHRAGWVWSPATYVWTPGGYVFVDGYWDYDFHRRGILFAPAYIHPRYYGDNRFYYRPYYAVDSDRLLLSLFVRAAVNHFVFGDYYDARYSRFGFTPWMDYRVRGQWHDPSYSYYRWRYQRDDPRWEENMRQRNVALRQNESARPPRTLAEQQKRSSVKDSQQVALVRPLDKLATTTNVKLRPVEKTEVQQIRKTAQQTELLRQQRAKVETQARALGTTAGARAVVKVELPKAKGDGKKRAADPSAPPRPSEPKAQAAPPAGKAVDDGQPDPQPRKKKGDSPGKKPPPQVDAPKGKGVDAPPPKPKARPKDDAPDLPPPAPKPRVDPKPAPPEKKAPPKINRPRDDEPDAPPPAPKPRVDPKPRPPEKAPRDERPPPPPPEKRKKKGDETARINNEGQGQVEAEQGLFRSWSRSLSPWKMIDRRTIV
jgi:hypothetical protein